MKKKYDVVKQGKKYHLVEQTTNTVVRAVTTQTGAGSLCKHLNAGGGFHGETPSFFLDKNEQLNIV